MNKSSRINTVIGVIIFGIFAINSHILFKNGYIVYDSPQNATTPSIARTNAPKILSIDDQSYLFNYTNETGPLSYFPNQRGAQKPSVANKVGGIFSDHQSRNYHVVCYKSKNDPKYIFPKWEKAHLIIYNALPFSIMLLCNSLIIYNIKFKSKVQSKAHGTTKRKRRMTVMLIIVTFSFMILTLPSVIVHTFFREFLSNKPYRRFVNLIVNNLLHTSHAINFFFYVLSAPNFRNEFIRFLNELRRFCRHKFNLSDDMDTRNRTNASLVSVRTQISRSANNLPKNPSKKHRSNDKASSENREGDSTLLETQQANIKNGSLDEDDEDVSSSSSSISVKKSSRGKDKGEFRLTELAAASKAGGALTSRNSYKVSSKETTTSSKKTSPSKATMPMT